MVTSINPTLLPPLILLLRLHICTHPLASSSILHPLHPLHPLPPTSPLLYSSPHPPPPAPPPRHHLLDTNIARRFFDRPWHPPPPAISETMITPTSSLADGFLTPKTQFLFLYFSLSLYFFIRHPLSSKCHITLPPHLSVTHHTFYAIAIFLSPKSPFPSLSFCSKFHLTLPPHLSVTHPPFPQQKKSILYIP